MNQAGLDSVMAEFGDHVTISRESITPCMINQAGLYAFYAVAHAQALRDSKMLKLTLENRRAAIRREFSRDTKKFTEAMLDEACQHDRAYLETSAKHTEAEYVENVLEVATRAFEHRRDMLVNLGATVREEMRSIEIRTPDKRHEEPKQQPRREFTVPPGDEKFAIGPEADQYVWGPGDYKTAIDQDVVAMRKACNGQNPHIWECTANPPRLVATAKLGQWQLKSDVLRNYMERQAPQFTREEIPF